MHICRQHKSHGSAVEVACMPCTHGETTGYLSRAMASLLTSIAMHVAVQLHNAAKHTKA